MKPELIVALDIPSSTALNGILDSMPKEITWFKIGLELFTADGPSALSALSQSNKRVFLDLKFHDIPNTVARAVSASARLNISMLTIHAFGGRAMMQAAADAARQAGKQAPKLIAVTTLTSLSQADLADMGVQRNVQDQVLALGEMALDSGMDGLVCSVHEATDLRRRFGPGTILVTPGIRPDCECGTRLPVGPPCGQGNAERGFVRPAGAGIGDQKRVATPAMAVEAGSDFLVVGRPILNAPDPHAAALAILKEMDAAKPRVSIGRI